MSPVATPAPFAAEHVHPPAEMLSTGLLPLVLPLPFAPPSSPAPFTSPPAPADAAFSTGLLPVKAPEPLDIRETTAAQDPVSPGRSSGSETPARRLLNEDGKATQLGLRPSSEATLPPSRPANERRSSQALKLFSLLLFIMLASFGAFSVVLYNFFEQHIEPRLGEGMPAPAGEPAHHPADPAPRDLKTELATTTQLAAVKDQISHLQAQKTELASTTTQLAAIKDQISRLQTQKTELASTAGQLTATTTQLAAARDQISGLQTQIDTLRSQQTLADSRLARLDLKREAGEDGATASQPSELATGLQAASPGTAGASPDSVALMQELRLLKERNRLTLYADQALANASSLAMANLWRTVRDPELAFVRDGAVAEIIRVQQFYGLMPGLPRTYRLPVHDMFHDDAIHSDTDLKDDQVIKLLLDDAQPPEVRTRAAILLSGRRDNKAGSALVEAMRHDSNLNVVKAAQNTLQENYELFAPRLFDAVGMETAWKQHLAKLANPLPPEIQVRPPKD